MNNKVHFLFLLLIAASFINCDRVPEDQVGEEMARFNAWIQVNGISENYKTSSGLYYISEREGTGEVPSDSDIVIYSYVVRNLDGFIYKNTYKDTAKLYDIYGIYNPKTHFTPEVNLFLLNYGTPKGLIEGISKMRVGGKSRMIMPSSLAYGKNGSSSISEYTSLIWDVELVRVFKGSFEEYEENITQKYLTDSTGFNLINDTVYYKKLLPNAIINKKPIKGDSVYVKYVGRYLDGFIFDTNIKKVALDSNIFNGNNKYYNVQKLLIGTTSVTKGYEFALKQMNEGEKAVFVIPSKYMYGKAGQSSGSTSIPPYTPLVFEIELVKVIPKTSPSTGS